MKRSFGPYEVERELARGGMGVVYAVRHRETGAAYALKTLPSLGAGADDLARFRREADLMGRLDHPGIVKVHSAGAEGGVAYLVQSLLPGGSLRDRLRERGRFPRDEAVSLVIELAEAVEHAHAHGVLHRDLKPDNVLFDGAGRAVLVDFGLGRDLGAESRRLTETGQVMGTPGYMAPEQVEGGRRDDPRTDVYGLGAILFALLAGEPPFSGHGLGLLARIVTDSAPDLSAVDPETPPELAATVARCLAKRPGDRFESAADLARVLRTGVAPSRPDLPAAGVGVSLGLALAAGLAVLAIALTASEPPSTSERPPATPTASLPSPVRTTPPRDTQGWRDILHLADARPQTVWERMRHRTDAPPPALREALVNKLTATAREINAAAGKTRWDEPVLDLKRGRDWAACLRSLRRLEAPLPAACSSHVPTVLTGLRHDSKVFPLQEQTSFVLEMVGLLGEEADLEQVFPSLLQFITGRKSDKERFPLLPAALELARRYPPGSDPAEWQDAQANLLKRLARFGSVLVYKEGHDKTGQRSLARRILEHVRALDLRVKLPQQAGLVWGAIAKANLHLGKLDEAGSAARRGWERKDLRSLAVLAQVRRLEGRGKQAQRLAVTFLKRLNDDMVGRSANIVMVDLLYELRPEWRPKAALVQGLRQLIRRKPHFHLWWLRLVRLELEAGRTEMARSRFRLLLDHMKQSRQRGWDCRCLEAEHGAIREVHRGPLTLERVAAALKAIPSEPKGP